MKKCDLVMKGGITSGVVYPRAVAELAKEYRFVNIGGTSAGAIAAAVTAAAEYARQNGDANAFDQVDALAKELAGTPQGDTRSRMLQLFQPSAETRPLYEVAVRWLETKSIVAVLRALVARFETYAGPAFALGTLCAVLIGIAAYQSRPMLGVPLAIVAVVMFVIGGVAAVIAAAIEALLYANRVLGTQQFGLCNGATHERWSTPGLTDWLHETIQRISGAKEVLTFGDLESVDVHLEVMTTNLTIGRPHRIPFNSAEFFFDKEEMCALFPCEVVERMIGSATPNREGFYPFPNVPNLPVVVAARMSLSFPLLLTAVPLRGYDRGRRREKDEALPPEICWFSDGGITSNFPLHFFDSPIPRWPTFAINLDGWTERYDKEGQRVQLPEDNSGGVLQRWRAIDGLVAFVTSIVVTMQDWRDNMLLHVPGQRDRIAHILLEDREGGLNLTMDEQQLLQIAGYGVDAAKLLASHFGDQPPAGVTTTWTNHKWVRFLSYMAALQRSLARFSGAYAGSVDDIVAGKVPPPSYKRVRLSAIRAAMQDFVPHAAADFAHDPFGGDEMPKPPLNLRPMPPE
ncbi:MAG TPA: patatin-like phospholipase family protein [Thermoanaerobaculia bacterium]|jgi:predicted acylesterase/phospholipase RssA